jgi:hypothetical protein
MNENRDKRFYSIGLPLLVAFVICAARFAFSRQFNLYFEDWARIPNAMTWNWGDFLEYISQVPGWLVSFEYEGRALHPAGIHTFAFIGNKIGGLSIIYLMGCGIAILNSLLFYYLLKRITSTESFALFGALAFAVFPAQSSQPLLTMALGQSPSLSLILISFHLYLNNNLKSSIASYIIAFISLFYYEKFLLLFCAAPLFKKCWGRDLWQEWGRHLGLILLMIAIVAFGRKITGEGRVSDLEPSSFMGVLFNMTVGPIVVANSFLKKPVQALFSLQFQWLLPLILCFVLIAYFIYKTLSSSSNGKGQIRTDDKSVSVESSMDLDVADKPASSSISPLRIWVAGLLMLILAYALNFKDNPFVTEGRHSDVHVAAVVGASFLMACLCSLIFDLKVFSQRRILASVLGGAYFTSLIAYGFVIQQDFVASAVYQRSFWTQIVRLCPDMTENSIILIEPDIFSASKKVSSIGPLNGGVFPVIPRYIYQFPDAWSPEGDFWDAKRISVRSAEPKVLILRNKWEKSTSVQDNNIYLTKKSVEHLQFADQWINGSDVILIGSENGQLFRRTEPLTLQKKQVILKQDDSNLRLPPFDPGVLYPYLIEEDKLLE